MKKLLFVNKTYKNDLVRSVQLFESFIKFYQGSVTKSFYIVVASNDIEIFINAFKDFVIKPIFITEEQIYKACNIDVNKCLALNGWVSRQICKIGFYRLGLCENYITLDSDLYFIQNFNDNLFFDKYNKLKVVVRGGFYEHSTINNITKFFRRLGRRIRGKFTFDKNLAVPAMQIARHLGVKNYKLSFVHGVGLWNCGILEEMFKHIKHKDEINDAYKMITTIPYEMQWYGTFTFAKYKKLITILDDGFCFILTQLKDGEWESIFKDKIYKNKHCYSIIFDSVYYKNQIHDNFAVPHQ